MSRYRLPQANEWMFQIVHCKAYMQKVHDGKHIQHYSAKETESGKEGWKYCDRNGTRDVEDGEWGGSDFIKTYYARKKADFVGIVVGMKEIVVTAELCLDYADPPYSAEYYYVTKYPHEKVKCAYVFYGMNRSRYVPLEDIEIVFNR